MELIAERVSKSLKLLRKELGLSQTEAGKKLGISQQSWANWEACRSVPEQPTWTRICEVFGKDLGWFFLDQIDNSRTRWYSPEELAQIRGHCRLDSWHYCQFLLHTGLRVGELLAMEWEDVHEGRFYVRPGKTGRGRWIPLTPTAERILQERRGFERPFPIGYDSLRRRFGNVLRRAGVAGTLHVFRHSFASMLVQRGASLYRVKSLLGHSSLKMTERYSHLGLTDLAEAVRLLEE